MTAPPARAGALVRVAVRRLQHVSSPYPAGRQEQVRAFYGELLGMVEITPPETLKDREVIWFRAGPGELELHFFPGTVDPEHPRHFCLEVADQQAVRHALEERGYKPYDTTPIPNRPRFVCRDPSGNLVEFTTILGDYSPRAGATTGAAGRARRAARRRAD